MKGRRVIFRADASTQIGSGHVMRCLTLADALRAQGADTIFASRALLEPLRRRIMESGHQLIELSGGDVVAPAEPGPALAHGDWLPVAQEIDAAQLIAAIAGSPCDWLVLDHYALDRRWEEALRPHCGRVFVLDDLADREHVADVLLDQNLGRNASDYAGLVPAACRLLIGPHWALLRPEFAAARAERPTDGGTGDIRRLLISLGGADPRGIALRVLGALHSASLPADCHITLVAGLTSPHLAELKAALAALPWQGEILEGVKDMAGLMAGSDLAIGAAGGTAWERCAVGLPTILLVLADNQVMAARALAATGAAWPVPLAELEAELPRMLKEIRQPGRLAAATSAAAAVSDGEGALRVVKALTALSPPLVTMRCADATDELRLLDWANDPVTRQNAFQTGTITAEAHHVWFHSRLGRPEAHRLFIAQRQPDVPIGQVRFDRTDTGAWEISYGLAPAFRGKGLGAAILEAGMAAIQAALGSVALVARVKLDNPASLRTFERLNFSRSTVSGEHHVTFHRRSDGQVGIAAGPARR